MATFNGHRAFPVCPRVLTVGEVAGWTAAEKITWIPITAKQASLIFFGAAKWKVRHINTGANLFVRLVPNLWNGTFWEPDGNPQTELFFHSADFVCDNYFAGTSSLDPTPRRKACRSTEWRTVLDAPDGDFLVNGAVSSFNMPLTGTAGSHFLVYDPALDQYYIGVRVRFEIHLNETIWPLTTPSTPPPPSTKYSLNGGFTIYVFQYTTNRVTTNLPSALFTFFGTSTTLKIDAGVSGTGENQETIEAVFEDTDPTYYFV
jgi:hypothetical protein